MYGWVYLVKDKSNVTYKIGVTRTDVEKRIKRLQTGNSTELLLIHKYFCEYPFRTESILHNKFRHRKELNEWFRLEPEEVERFDETCKEVDDFIHEMLDNPFFAKNLH